MFEESSIAGSEPMLPGLTHDGDGINHFWQDSPTQRQMMLWGTVMALPMTLKASDSLLGMTMQDMAPKSEQK